MRRRKLAVLAVGAVAALGMLAACGADVTSGTVTEKRHTEAVVGQDTDRKCVRKDKKGKCVEWREVVDVGDWETKDPERWEICLRNVNGDEGCVDVDQATYDSVNVGEQYPRPRR